MINKRLLIKNLLTYNDENSFYDKKRQLNLHYKEGKAKFLKHICALSNANPKNNSYIVVGVEDEGNSLTGVDFFDDSKIQNLVNAYLVNAPLIQYENIPFPSLPKNKVLGLVTIKPKQTRTITSFKKSIYKYYSGNVYKRIGSNSALMQETIILSDENAQLVEAIEKSSKTNIKLTLDAVFEFFNKHQKRNPKYQVFKEQFVLCWSGVKKMVGDEVFFSRVDIEMVSEQIQLFYSSLDEVTIHYNASAFIITEYITLGIQQEVKKIPLEKQVLHFSENGTYSLASEFLFIPPSFDKKILFHVYNASNALINKLKANQELTSLDRKDLLNLPTMYLILKLNGFDDAIERLIEAKPLLKQYSDAVYQEFKEVMRINRKIKYETT